MAVLVKNELQKRDVFQHALTAGRGKVGTLVESELDPLPINGLRSYRVTFSYQAANEARRQSIIFLNSKPTEQILVQTDSAERNFHAISARAFNIIRHWQEIRLGDEGPFN